MKQICMANESIFPKNLNMPFFNELILSNIKWKNPFKYVAITPKGYLATWNETFCCKTKALHCLWRDIVSHFMCGHVLAHNFCVFECFTRNM